MNKRPKVSRKFLVLYGDGYFRCVKADTKEEAAKASRFGSMPKHLNMDAPYIPVINVLGVEDLADISRQLVAYD